MFLSGFKTSYSFKARRYECVTINNSTMVTSIILLFSAGIGLSSLIGIIFLLVQVHKGFEMDFDFIC